MLIAAYKIKIKNVARLTDICLLTDMEQARMSSDKMHCVDFRVFDREVSPPVKLENTADAKE